MRRLLLGLVGGMLFLGLSAGMAAPVSAQDYSIGKGFYYPYHYFPANYWPAQGPQWPEKPGAGYMRPPAYMAFPPFREPDWHYDYLEPMPYYRGFHFWLDQF